MSIDQRTDPRAPEEPKPAKVDLSLSQVIGGALAAMTAAVIGSRLSVAGTVIGAALASAIAAVAGAVYTAWLRATRGLVSGVVRGGLTQRRDGAHVLRFDSSDAGSPSAGSTTSAAPNASPPDAGLPAPSRAPRAPGSRSVRGVSWKAVVVAALAAFGIALVAVTGFELTTGHALSGGRGTTIGEVSSGNTGPTHPTPAANPTSTATTRVSSAPSDGASSSAPSSQPAATPTPGGAVSATAPASPAAPAGSVPAASPGGLGSPGQ